MNIDKNIDNDKNKTLVYLYKWIALQIGMLLRTTLEYIVT